MTTAGGEEGSIASRVFQAGGVAIQEASPEIKQRLSSPTYIVDGQIGQYNKEEIKKLLATRGIPQDAQERLSQPMPYEKEYVVAGALFPIYWHSLLLETEKREKKMSEPQMVAYSFLETLKRIGAGHPKGAEIFHHDWLGSGKEPLLTVDIYKEPLGKRPVISPMETAVEKAIEEFVRKSKASDTVEHKFERHVGETAHRLLRKLASGEETESSLLSEEKNETI